MSVFPQYSGEPFFPAYWLENAVFGLDRWLRRRQGIFEYTDDPACIFRIQRALAEGPLTLSSGAQIEPGMPILNLHLWNEHVPLMGPGGATIGWACHASRGIRTSLRQLAAYLANSPELDDIAALRAEMRLGTAKQGIQLLRLTARCGFEPAEVDQAGYWWSRSLRNVGESILIFLLGLATNPVAVGAPVLRRERKLVYLSRPALERRYGRAWNAGVVVRKRGAPGAC